MTATEYYQHQSAQEDEQSASLGHPHSRADNGKQPTLLKQKSSDAQYSNKALTVVRANSSLNVNGHHIDAQQRLQPQATPSKGQSRAIDHPNEAFFSNDFSRQGNVSVMRDEKVGSVVLAPAVPQPQQPSVQASAQPTARPSTGINLNALVASVSSQAASHNGNNLHQQHLQQQQHQPQTAAVSNTQPSVQPAAASSQYVPPPALSPNRRNQAAHDDAHLRKSRMHWPISQHPEKAIHIDEDIVDEVDETQDEDTNAAQVVSPPAAHMPTQKTAPTAVTPIAPHIQTTPQTTSNHHQTLTQIYTEHEVLLTHLTPRLSQIRSLRKSWVMNDINTCFIELQSITDHVVSHTFLSTIEQHCLPSEHTDVTIHFSLEQCHLLLVSLPRILGSPITPCVATALRYIDALLQLFSPVMQAALTQHSKSMGVDLARDDRLVKARECYAAFKHIYPRLPALSQRDQPVGPLAGSVKSSLDTLIAMDKAQRASQQQPQQHFSQLKL